MENTKKTIVEASEFNSVYAKEIEAGTAQHKSAPKVKIQHKAIDIMEQWWVRYLIAIAFIFIVPKVKAIINGEVNGGGDDDEEEDNDFKDFSQYLKFKRSMN